MNETYERMLRDVCDAMCEYEKGYSDLIHHFLKVHAFARQIALHEGMHGRDLFTMETAAYTHDIGIPLCLQQTGACPGPLQERLGPPEADRMLRACGLPEDVISRVCFLIGHHHTTDGCDALDWRILLEADYLVNMIEGSDTDEQINAVKREVFRTEEGLKLLGLVRPRRS